MSKNPTVSGVMIFLDAESFIAEAIDSVLGQTYQDWELLLVDDGSTDGSSEIAHHYVAVHPNKIRYLEHEGHQNKGMSASRNLGIRYATGQYVCFLDADDVWLPNKLEQQVPLMESQPQAAMLYGRTQFWFSWTGKTEDRYRDCLTKRLNKADTLVAPPKPLIFYLQNEQVYPCTCSVMIRRDVFEKIGTFEEAFINANEDMVFYSKVFLEAPVFISSKCWDRYRINSGGYWVNYWKNIRNKSIFPHVNQPHPERLKYLNWLAGYLSETGIDHLDVWQALRKAYWPYKHPQLYRIISPFRFLVQKARRIARKIANSIFPRRLEGFH